MTKAEELRELAEWNKDEARGAMSCGCGDCEELSKQHARTAEILTEYAERLEQDEDECEVTLTTNPTEHKP